jgi:protein-tyrosine phosphatase
MSKTPERPAWIRAGDEPLPEEARRRVAGLLEEGEVVALPTETVYGLAVRADRAEALERLARIKGEAEPRPYSWHIGTREIVEQFPPLLPLTRRLVERYWPGPLTLVLGGVPEGLDLVARDGCTGLRFPAQRATADLLASLPFPVVATSANARGGEPASEAGQIAERFGDLLALIVDGGPSRISSASGVLRLAPGHFDLLREGLHSLDDLRGTAGLDIAFVCTGNTCRSPMAEGLARRLLAERLGLDLPSASASSIEDFGFRVSSMGVVAGHGSPASKNAVEAMAERDIDIAAHETRPAIAERVRDCDRVYALTRAHVDSLRGLLPPGADQGLALLDPQGADIPDPIGGSLEEYRRCARRILDALEARLSEWA